MQSFAEDMVARHGLHQERVEALLLDARFLHAILRSAASPGTARPWSQFCPEYLKPERVKGGVAFWQAHEPLLAQAREAFGVPEEVVVAIVGVETVYGRVTGRHRVLDALVTLGFQGQSRTPFFRGELEALLLLDRDGVLDPLSVLGSYAGAMGWPQFMPSSIRRFGVDFDGDGRVDLWASPADVIGSVANYFRHFGWCAGADVILRATVTDAPAVQSLIATGVKPTIGRGEFEAAGVTPSRPLGDHELGALMMFEGESGPEHWVGLENFYVITRYNRSQNYALAVWQLAQAIADMRRRSG
jgi:membrane-bound lytic murein transglycosylase B